MLIALVWQRIRSLLMWKEFIYPILLISFLVVLFHLVGAMKDKVDGWFHVQTKDGLIKEIAHKNAQVETLVKAKKDQAKIIATQEKIHEADLKAIEIVSVKNETVNKLVVKTKVQTKQKVEKINSSGSTDEQKVVDASVATIEGIWTVYCILNQPTPC